MAQRKAAREAELVGERAAAAALAESLVALKVLVAATAHARCGRGQQHKAAILGFSDVKHIAQSPDCLSLSASVQLAMPVGSPGPS